MEFTACVLGTADLRTKYADVCKELIGLNEAIDAKLKLLEDKEKQWSETMANVAHNATSGTDKVKLNVGGRMFETSRATLLQGERTYFHALLGNPGRWQPCEKDGAYFIDRDPELFQHVFASIRFQEPTDTSGFSAVSRKRLRIEEDYYQLTQSPMRLLSWDPATCSRNLTLREQNRVVAKTHGGSNYNAAALCNLEVPSFTVRVEGVSMEIGVGFANPVGFDGNAMNFKRQGSYQLHCSDGRLLQGTGTIPGFLRVGARMSRLPSGTVIRCTLDRVASTISFVVDGVDHPATFDVVGGSEVLVPSVEIHEEGGCVSLLS